MSAYFSSENWTFSLKLELKTWNIVGMNSILWKSLAIIFQLRYIALSFVRRPVREMDLSLILWLPVSVLPPILCVPLSMSPSVRLLRDAHCWPHPLGITALFEMIREAFCASVLQSAQRRLLLQSSTVSTRTVSMAPATCKTEQWDLRSRTTGHYNTQIFLFQIIFR